MSDAMLGPQHVFVIHGRDVGIRDAMFDLLAAAGLQPLEWSQALKLTGEPNPFIGQVLERAFSVAKAVVVLLTPDDLASLDPSLQLVNDPDFERRPTGQARPNVLFEAGMSIGRYPERTVLVEIGPLRPFSDIAGRHILRFDGGISHRLDLLRRLEAAGCVVDLSGERWQQAGDFHLQRANISGGSENDDEETAGPSDLNDEFTDGLTARLVPATRSSRPTIVIKNIGTAVISSIRLEIPSDQPALLLTEFEVPPIVVPGHEVFYTVALLDEGIDTLTVILSGDLPDNSRLQKEVVVSLIAVRQ